MFKKIIRLISWFILIIGILSSTMVIPWIFDSYSYGDWVGGTMLLLLYYLAPILILHFVKNNKVDKRGKVVTRNNGLPIFKTFILIFIIFILMSCLIFLGIGLGK